VRRAVAQVAWFCVALLAGAWLGEWSALWVQWGARPTADFAAMLPRVLRWLPIGLVAGAILVARERTRDIAARLHALEVRRLQIEQQQTAVQLQVLQSQIEPHFLFNTLATIRRLQHTDPARGQETLAGFIDYLKSSLPEMRSTETTLGRELDLIGAYLDVLQVRMGDRLRVQIDAAPSLRRQRIPPLSIATLVENAIKHGIGSLLEGGTVSVSAWIDEGALHVRVADTGLGFAASEGTGTGLANLRMRLRALYGDAGGLTLAPNAPRGFAATLRVPATRDGYD
jgi:LytS/YehU family sensor histidine kinase